LCFLYPPTVRSLGESFTLRVVGICTMCLDERLVRLVRVRGVDRADDTFACVSWFFVFGQREVWLRVCENTLLVCVDRSVACAQLYCSSHALRACSTLWCGKIQKRWLSKSFRWLSRIGPTISRSCLSWVSSTLGCKGAHKLPTGSTPTAVEGVLD